MVNSIGPCKIRQICNIKPEDVAKVRSKELLAKLELEEFDLNLRESFAVLDKLSILVVQSEQHLIIRLMAGGGAREAQDDLEETDSEKN